MGWHDDGGGGGGGDDTVALQQAATRTNTREAGTFLAAAALNDQFARLHSCFLFYLFSKMIFSHLIVVRRQLIEQLLDSELLPGAVHVRDLILRQTGEIQLDLQTVETYVVARGD